MKLSLKITLIIILLATVASTATSTLIGWWTAENWRNYMTITINNYENEIDSLKEELNRVTTANNSCQVLLADTKREFKEFSNWHPEPNRSILKDIKYIQQALRRRDVKSVVFTPTLANQDLAWLRFNKDICILGSMGPYCITKFRRKYKGKGSESGK